MNPNLLRAFLTKNNDDKDCDCHQPTWLSLALAILPAVLPVLVEKLGTLLMHWLFGDEEESTEEQQEKSKKRKKSKKDKRKADQE